MDGRSRRKARLVGVLGALFAVEFAWLALRPVSRSDWALENGLAVGLVVLLGVTRKRFPLSTLSYVSLFVFLGLHEIGAHYTYAQVPYDAFLRRWTGWSPDEAFGFERNQFDRLVHFCYGLLFAMPIREVYLRIADVEGFWGYFLPLDFAMSTSMLYELLEWAAALLVGGDLGQTYLGTQGDVWDAQKDMGLASLGALIAMGTTAVVHAATHRDFARELTRSLRIKDRGPGGSGG